MEALETWKPAVGLEDRFEVSSIGRVRSRRSKTGSGRIRKLPIDAGYRRLGYQDWETRKIVSQHVHVLVAKTFIGSRPEGNVVRHLDGDSLNNCVENLAYGTIADNVADAIAHGTHTSLKKGM